MVLYFCTFTFSLWFSLMMVLCRMSGKCFWFHNYYAYSSVHIIIFHLHTNPPEVSPPSVHDAMNA